MTKLSSTCLTERIGLPGNGNESEPKAWNSSGRRNRCLRAEFSAALSKKRIGGYATGKQPWYFTARDGSPSVSFSFRM